MASENGSKASAVDESCDASPAARQRKKRKWDQPAESLVPAGVIVPRIPPLHNMGSFVGVSHSGITTLLNPPVTNASQPKLQDEVIAREIVINDAETSLRFKLTKRQTQEEIQKRTGAIVITRGKYRPPNAMSDADKPLYLHISAGAHLKEMAEKIMAVDRAAAIVEEMLKQSSVLQAASKSHASERVVNALNACVFLGFETDPSANIVSRIRGPNDQYINHIMNETGATVLLRGRGAVYAVVAHNEGAEQEPLHLFISSNNSKSLKDARLLAENLLDTISMEFGVPRISSLKMYNAVSPPQHLLPAIQSSSSGRKVNTSADTLTGTPIVGSLYPPSPLLLSVPEIATVVPRSVVSQPDFAQHVQHSLASCTSYSGYGGIYPQATPLQQVAFALKQPSTPVTSTVVSPYLQDLDTCARSTVQKERELPRRRKFQELPVATEGSTEEHKVVSRESVADISAKHISMMPASKKLVQPSSNGMPPPPPRSMPLPPPPKFTSSKTTSKVNEKKSSASRPDYVPDTLVKLMEYGDDDEEEEEDSVETIQESSQNRVTASGTPKPFWAL